MGDHYPEKVKRNNGHEQTDALSSSLAKAGYQPADITDVLFTHLHWDHCNGAVVRENNEMKLLFPNATHWCSRQQWDHAKISNPREQAAFYPEILDFLHSQGRLQLVEEQGELFPDISVRMYSGHTPGQMIPFIHTETETIVYMSDFIPTAAHIPRNNFV